LFAAGGSLLARRRALAVRKRLSMLRVTFHDDAPDEQRVAGGERRTFVSRVSIQAAIIGLLLLCGGGTPARTQTPSTFGADVAALSESGGYFDTDNLISNERSYLEVVPDLKKRGVSGGAYLGVGPDQNFSYIAAIRPDIAVIVDIRRDNMLLHLLFKALFGMSRTRVEYVAHLLGRPVPAGVESWRDASIQKIVEYAGTPALDGKGLASLRAQVDEAVGRTGVPLSREDRETIDRFHRRFIEAGTGLRFQTTGRQPQSHYPTYGELLLGTDADGTYYNFLASEDAFQFLRSLQQRNLVVPVVGDISGPRALTAISTYLEKRKTRVSAFYVSNVEFYLFGDGRFPSFAANLGRLPRSERSVLIRSVFGRYGWPRGGSVSQLHPIGELLDDYAKGRIRYYDELLK
jgi:hypothetical protein